MSDDKKMTFESKLNKLEEIVNQLEKGDIPLQKAMDQFKEGMDLGKELQNELENAEKTVMKIEDDNDSLPLNMKSDNNK